MSGKSGEYAMENSFHEQYHGWVEPCGKVMVKPTILAFHVPVWQGLGALCQRALCSLRGSHCPPESSDMKGCIMPEKKMKFK